MYKQKKIAAINDLSGYGRCALSVSMPIISALKVQCCPLPTAILSGHMGYPGYFFDSYTEKMPGFIEHWKMLELEFDGILTGFLSSPQQISIVSGFIKDFRKKDTLVVVDPIMGDHGRFYASCTDETLTGMKRLSAFADILLPNITEASLLTDTLYIEDEYTDARLLEIGDKLHAMGPKQVVITGLQRDGRLLNYISEQEQEPYFSLSERTGGDRPGTGDIFAAIVAAEVLQGRTLISAVKKAEHFIGEAVRLSDKNKVPRRDGVCFEEVLELLIK